MKRPAPPDRLGPRKLALVRLDNASFASLVAVRLASLLIMVSSLPIRLSCTKGNVRSFVLEVRSSIGEGWRLVEDRSDCIAMRVGLRWRLEKVAATAFLH